MSQHSAIEWTDSTWNPLRGCSRVSEGCRNCYAEAVAYRFSGAGLPYAGLAVLKNGHASWTGKVELIERHLSDPLKWKTPRRIFVNSMSDLFHETVPDEWIDRIFAVMALCPEHTFQILTKRAERMRKYCDALTNRQVTLSLAIVRTPWWDSSQSSPCAVGTIEDRIGAGPLPNVWLGVSVENQAAADERIPLLLQTPASVRFISAEPLLGPLQIPEYLPNKLWNDLPSWKEPELDWVICGGESGPGARPMHPDWPQGLRDQCAAAGVPFFFKQWGNWGPHSTPEPSFIEKARGACNWFEWPDLTWSHDWGKKIAGARLDGVEHKNFPAVEVAHA